MYSGTRTVCCVAVSLFTVTLAGAQSPVAPSLSPLEQKMAASVDAHNAADQALLQQIVDINSGTMHLAGVETVKDILVPRFEALGFQVRWVPMQAQTARAGDLIAEHPCPQGEGKCGKRLLLIGHMDTVFEPSSSFQKYSIVPNSGGKIATGPGIADMKGGLVVMLAALRAMQEAGALDKAEIRIVLSGDEERFGAPVDLARRDLIAAAKQSDVALEFEPSARFNGQDSISIARRSSTTWHLETTGLSGHSSQIFGDRLGYGAIYEMTRILDSFRKELPEEGLTYNAGLILGGATAESNSDSTGGTATGKANVIAASAFATGDIRTLNNDQTERTESKMQAIVAAHLPRTDAKITFDEGYPAMARTPAGEHLLNQWNEVSIALGLGPVAEGKPMTRGAGDIAFATTYVPGLVGTGMLGEGYHAEGETAYLDSLARQAKRDAVLMGRLSREPGNKAQVARDQLPGLGDSPADAGPIASDLSPALQKKDVVRALRKVADWQLPRVEQNYSQDWTFAALYAGFMAVPPQVHGNAYQDAMQQMGKQFNWQLGPRAEHADDHAVGQTYLEFYEKTHDHAILAPTQERMDTLIQRTGDPVKPLWWWCDALFMAPPVLADLSKITGDPKYLDFMNREWWTTSKLLYDPQLHLYSRDASFLDKHEANGAKVFWSRGNGWVMAGLVRVLAAMPENYPDRPQYIAQFQQMAQALAAIQSADGLWRPGLLDAEAYKLPEVSGSAFNTYALAWGIHHGILDRKQYLPVVKKAWAGLLTHIYQDGRLGCIQPIGAAPGQFTSTSSYVFGVGAFLLAGSEVYALSAH